VTLQVLIDAIVRQATVLIAQIATTGGVRAPLAHVANQVFLDLADEIEAQGISRKVGADMFGMALRAYVRKVQRLRGSRTDGTTLWEAIYRYIGEAGLASRQDVIRRFGRDEEDVVRGVLHDLCESGLVFATGGSAPVYRAASPDELGRLAQLGRGDLDDLLWVIVYREGPLDRAALVRLARSREADVDAALERLVGEGRVEVETRDGSARYRARVFIVPLGAQRGWEAAVLDHIHAVVRTICQKLATAPAAEGADVIGGSTYTYAIWPDHPLADEVRSSLRRLRAEHGALRQRVETMNRELGIPYEYEEVVFYGGQSILSREQDDNP
jgi:hypothetical protein